MLRLPPTRDDWWSQTHIGYAGTGQALPAKPSKNNILREYLPKAKHDPIYEWEDEVDTKTREKRANPGAGGQIRIEYREGGGRGWRRRLMRGVMVQ